MADFKETTIQSYDKTVDEYIKNTDKYYPTDEMEKFISYLPKGSLIPDLGCGYGRDSKLFVDKGFRVKGVDLSKKMVEKAKERIKNIKVQNAEFQVMDINNIEFEDNLFDGIWANASLLHIPKDNIKSVLDKVFRILKNEGIFYIAIKKGEGEVFEEDKRYGDIKKFWSYYGKDEIEEKLKESRFKILDSYVRETKSNYSTHPWIVLFCRK